MRYLRQMMFALAVLATVPGALAQALSPEPLVTIRFNQRSVYYEKQLYKAISAAAATKPGVMIDVMSYAPVTGDPGADAQWQQAASYHTQMVVSSMQRMGVPAQRITVRGEGRPGLRFDETQVFVR